MPDGPKGLTPARFDPLRAKVSGRGAQFTEFVNPDGSSTRVVSPEVVNFKDSAGVWRPVDSGLESDPGIVGGLRSKSNSWRARFGLASKGVAWESASGVTVGLVPVGGAGAVPVGSGSVARYAGVWPGVDVTYEVTGSAVKETLLLTSARVATSFEYRVVAGSSADVVAGRAGGVSLAGVKADGLGFVSLDRAGVAGLRVAAPLVTRSDGAPVSEANPVMSVNAAGNVVISIDAAWLRAQPASAFPVALDPSLYWAGTDDERSYKSDGYSCSGCGIQFGNSRDNNTNKYWRSMVHFPYATVFNAQIVDAWLDVSYRSGSADTSLPITAWAASAFSYGGVIQSGYQVGSGSLAAGLSGGGLRSYVEQYVNNQSSTMWIGFTGSEGSSYTYQKIWATLYITFNRWPSAPVRVSPAPVDGSSAHTLTYTLAASSTDADGDTWVCPGSG